MLTPEQINVLGDRAADIAKPINDFLISDIARRVAGAGQLTSTAAYQIYRAQQLDMSREEIEKALKKKLDVSAKELEKLLTQSAEVGYRFDLDQFTVEAIPFAENIVLQQIVSSAVKLVKEDFTNLTQTLGMVAQDGKAYPLQKSYQKCMDFAFEQVITGAADYNTAIRQATKNLADKGVRTIDYESGVHTSLEAAVRRNVMGGLGLMQENISEENHDKLGADGWEISAHGASAPDHEPIQGRQYSDKEYKKLNNSLVRRIGTLNCGHAAFPIILGVNSPMYTDEELEQFRKDNEEGVTYNGKHYTLYEATQKQRQIERGIRKQKNRILVDEATDDADKLLLDRIKLVRYNDEYTRFSKGVNLPTQHERAKVANFDYKNANVAYAEYKRIAKIADSMYDTGSTDGNINSWLRDKPIRDKIKSGKVPANLNRGQQNKHIEGTHEYKQYVNLLKKSGRYGPSRLTISYEQAEALVKETAGTGIILRDKNGNWRNQERITMYESNVGISVNDLTGKEAETTVFTIHYGKNGAHIVPDYPSRKGMKGK